MVAPKGLATRPPLDHIKEALFNILGERVTGRRVLDLFAGSGSLGIEALSRGADFGVFVERSPAAVKTVKTNLERTKFTKQAFVMRGYALQALTRGVPPGGPFNLIFLDPPFRISVIELGALFEALRSGSGVAEDALIVLRLSAKRESPVEPGFVAETARVYGDSRLIIYQREAG